MVEIEKAGVEFFAGGRLRERLEFFHEFGPRKGSLGGAGVGVVKAGVAKPGDLSGGGDCFAKHFHDVVLPGDFLEKLL